MSADKPFVEVTLNKRRAWINLLAVEMVTEPGERGADADVRFISGQKIALNGDTADLIRMVERASVRLGQVG